LNEIELQNKETEVENALAIRNKERQELENDMRETYIREMQSKQIEMENRKRVMAESEHELRK
jgi:hypothetical protein